MFKIEFHEPVCLEDFTGSLRLATMTSRERRIKGRNPTVQCFPGRPGVIGQSSTWYLLKCGQRYVDVLAGVLAGEGYPAKIEEASNPWEVVREEDVPEHEEPPQSQ